VNVDSDFLMAIDLPFYGNGKFKVRSQLERLARREHIAVMHSRQRRRLSNFLNPSWGIPDQLTFRAIATKRAVLTPTPMIDFSARIAENRDPFALERPFPGARWADFARQRMSSRFTSMNQATTILTCSGGRTAEGRADSRPFAVTRHAIGAMKAVFEAK
jgi:hypothetical protein